MPQVLTYYGGQRGVKINGAGVRIVSTVPASAVVDTSWRHGMKQVVSYTGAYDALGYSEYDQPFDGRTTNFGGNEPLPYVHADNKDPGATGAALTITTPCVVIKTRSIEDADVAGNRGYLLRRDPIFFIDHTPATNALPPPIGAVPLVSRYTKASISLAAFPSLATLSGAPAPTTLLNSIRFLSNYEYSVRPQGDYYAARAYEQTYASDQAATYANVGQALCSNIDTTVKELLAAHVVIHAQNIVEVLNAGCRYNAPLGLGGILAGRKLFVVLAYLLTGDSYFGDWAVRTDWAAEDAQVQRVTAAHVAAYDYEPLDEGMGEWSPNWIRNPSDSTRLMTSTYRNIFFRHLIAAVNTCLAATGGKAAWNNNAMFDYADRMMERTLYNGSGTDKYARTLTGSNAPATNHKLWWDAYRTAAGMPAVWNW